MLNRHALFSRDLDLLDIFRFEPFKDLGTVFSPAFDVVESKESFILMGDLPGVAKDDLEVSLEKGLLIISGKRVATTDTKDFCMRERFSGTFRKTFSLPEDLSITEESISADLTDGVFTLVIPKVKKTTPKKLAITVK